MFSFNLIFHSLFFCRAFYPKVVSPARVQYYLLLPGHIPKRWQDERITLMGKLISCWSEAAKTLLSPRVLLRTACQEFHSPQSIWRPFRDQTLSWPEPSWATQLIRSSPLLSNFPSLSLSNSHPLCLLPNYSPLMRTSVGRKQNWEEVFLSQNKYFPELHNLNQPGSITYVALPESISCLYCIAIFFGKSTELIVLLF